MRRREPGTNEVQFSAKWQKEFHLKRDPASEMDLLTLTGGAAIQQPSRKSGLKGEQIQFWFDRPTPAADPPQRASVTINMYLSWALSVLFACASR